MILGGLIVVLLAAAYFLMGSGRRVVHHAGRSRSPARRGSTQPTASPAAGHKPRRRQTKSTLVLTGRNPFQCIVCPPAPQSSPAAAAASNTTTNTVTSNGLYAGGAIHQRGGPLGADPRHVQARGDLHAQVTVDNTTYAPAVGQRFASNFKLVSAGGGCARILYGDSSFTLCA